MGAKIIKINYAMAIPNAVMQHPDGTPMSYIDPEIREKIIEYINGKGVSDEQWQIMSGMDKESLIKEAKHNL